MSKIVDRIKEPSSHAGVGLIVATIAAIIDGSIGWEYGVPTLLSGFAALFLPEARKD